MSKPTLEDLQRIWRTNHGNDLAAMLQVLALMEPLLSPEQCRLRERQAAEDAYNWCCNATYTGWDAFAAWRRERLPVIAEDAPLSQGADPEPTAEAVAAFNARQLELRRAYVMGYEEVLPEHRAEGVEKAALRFPLKRLISPPSEDYSMSEGVRMKRMVLDGHPIVNFSSRLGWMDRSDLLAALALLDAAPRVEDVPLEEEGDA